MTERATQLHAIADGQIEELIGLISTLDEAALRRPCPGREKLGDGTIAASARHTADNYERIASFVVTSDRMSAAHSNNGEHGAGQQDDEYTAQKIDPGAVIVGLSASRDALQRIAELADGQLDAVPPKDAFRFCDGQRTLEQILAALLKHQRHQLEALKRSLD